MITKTTFEESKNIMEHTASAVIADVREECEYATGHVDNAVNMHVDNAVNMPLSALVDVPEAEGKAFAKSLIPDKNTPIMVYCRTGKRSSLAAETLDNFGYQTIYDMGSLSGWPYDLSYD